VAVKLKIHKNQPLEKAT